MVTIAITADFGAASVMRWIADWGRVADAAELHAEFPDADRREAKSERPPLLCLVASAFSSRYAKGLPRAHPPESEAERMSLAALCVVGQLEKAWRAPGGDPNEFLVHHRLHDLSSARDLAEAMSRRLDKQAPNLSPSVSRMARFVVQELAANVVQHSGRPETGFGLVQADLASSRLEIAFADAGVGFRESLSRNPELDGRIEDDAQALQIALAPRITGSA